MLHGPRTLDPAGNTLIEVVCDGLYIASNGTPIPILQVWHLGLFTGDEDLFDPSFLASQFGNAITDPMQAFTPPAFTLNVVTVRSLNNPTNAGFSVDVEGVGTVTGDSQPIMVAAKADLVTGLRGRNFRGRKHFAPVPESFTTLDRLNDTGLAALTAITDAVLAGQPYAANSGSGVSYNIVVLARSLSSFPASGPPTVVYADVVSILPSAELGTMKRRKESLHVGG